MNASHNCKSLSYVVNGENDSTVFIFARLECFVCVSHDGGQVCGAEVLFVCVGGRFISTCTPKRCSVFEWCVWEAKREK